MRTLALFTVAAALFGGCGDHPVPAPGGTSDAAPTAYGLIEVFQSTPDPTGAVLLSTVTAWFGVPAYAQERVIGPCSFTVQNGPPSTLVAGAVSVGFRDGGVTLEPQNGAYPGWSTRGRVFEPFDPIAFSVASGEAVHGFGKTVLLAPPLVDVSTPSCPQGSCPAHSRAEDLTLSWSNTNGEAVVATFASADSSTIIKLVCVFHAPNGSGTVPHAALELLPPGAVSVGFVSRTSQQVQNTEAATTLTASQLLSAGGQMTLE